MQFGFSPLVWLAFSGVLFACGEYLSKKYILAPQWSVLCLLVIMYCAGALAWLPALMVQKDLSLTGVLWSVISLCTTVLIGVFIFGEDLSALRIIGIVLAVAAVVVLSFD